MPIIEIQALPQLSDTNITRTMKRLTEEVAVQCGYSPEDITVTWRTILAQNYADGGKTTDFQKRGTHAPLVTVLAYNLTDQAKIEQLLKCVGGCLEQLLNLPANVFVRYVSVNPGMVYDRGKVI